MVILITGFPFQLLVCSRINQRSSRHFLHSCADQKNVFRIFARQYARGIQVLPFWSYGQAGAGGDKKTKKITLFRTFIKAYLPADVKQRVGKIVYKEVFG